MPSSTGSAAQPLGSDPFGIDPLAPKQVFRRRSTVIFAWMFVAVPLVIGVLIGVREIHHGLVGVATIVGALPVAVTALIMGVWPHVALGSEELEVHNSVFWFGVPYVSVSELKPTRFGLVIRTYSGKLLPVTAYASGSGKRVLGHADAADELTRAVQERIAFADDSNWREAPPPARHIEKRNLIVLGATVAAAVVLIVLANLTPAS
jgi:hypothetical protein